MVAVSGYQQHANCKQSLLQFNLAALAGKTIDSATLRLTASQVPTPSTAYSPRNWFIGTATQAWGSGVTWNTTPGYYLATAIELSPPTAINQVATVNLTAMVQAWTNGSLPNYGLQLAIGNYNLPNPLGNSWDTFYLYSTEEPTVSLRPTLTITYR